MLAVARRKLIRPNLFAYPGTRAGFDPSHPMAQQCVFSVVASGANATLLNTGAIGTPGGTVGAAVYSNMGPVATLTTLTSGISFSGQSTAVTLNFTIGGIFYFATLSTTNIVSTGITNSTGVNLSPNVSNQLGAVYIGVNRITSTFVPTTNVPYFVAVSRNQSTANFVVVNLNTGQIAYAASVGGGTGTPAAPSGTFSLGYDTAFSPSQGGYAAAMFSPVYSSLQQLALWASAPWAFWYPNK